MKYTGSNQRIPEYHAWVCLCVGMGARSYVELGCGSAHSLMLAGVGNIVTVDLLPNGLSGIRHIAGDSHDPAVHQQVLEMLNTSPDVVFIDADHDSNEIKKDFDLWWPDAGIAVGFHDILMPSVQPFWEVVRQYHPSIEIIAKDIHSANVWQHGRPESEQLSGDVNCGGIGVLFK